MVLLDTLYRGGLLPADLNPQGIDYTHPTVDIQMSNYGVRGLELDIYNDPTGGKFATRKVNSFVGLPETVGIAGLNTPGLKVLHIKDVDYDTQYTTFVQALQAIKRWSDMHPKHLPLFINIETKKDSPADNSTLAGLGFTPAVPFDAAAADAIDAELKSVFGNTLDKVLTPDKIRGALPTLNAAVTQRKLPTLGAARGKIIFIMEGDALSFYKAGRPSLQVRAAFVYGEAGAPETVFMLLNDAKTSGSVIKQRVQEGYIVRTRADSDTREARMGDYTTMNLAMQSGAQIISTDYYRPDPRGGIKSGWSTYFTHFPNNELARKNSVNAAAVKVDNSLTE